MAPKTADARDIVFKQAVNEQVRRARQVAPEIGVEIVAVGSGESVYSYRAETLRIIASNTKLFTTAAALDRLGPGYFFETPVRFRGELVGGELLGDLAVVGGGDPHLSGREHGGDSFGAFRLWAAALRRLGIERVAGGLYLAHGLFDDAWVHPDWPRDQLTRWYEAPVASLSFNDNCVLVRVKPNGPAGTSAKVETVPELPLFEVRSSALVTGRSRDQALRIGRASDRPLLTVGGRIYRGTESYDKWVTVPDPVAYFGSALRQAFREEGITISGATHQVESLPEARWHEATTHRTDLLTALEIINKRSQNFYAESVLKLLGARSCDDGTWEGGRRAVAAVLSGVGLEPGTYRLADGSGMSRNNRFSPRHVTRLLSHMFTHRWGKEFIKTLPYSGELGLSWEKRLAEPPYRGNVLAKTGYLNGVSSLSGYAKAQSGEVYAFSLLLNAIRGRAQAKSAEDRIVRALIDHG